MKSEIKTKGGRWICGMESTTKPCRSKGKGASCLIRVVFLAMTSTPIDKHAIRAAWILLVRFDTKRKQIIWNVKASWI